MYKLLCSNLSKSHRSLTNFTGYYRKVAQKCNKYVSGGKKYISETDLKNKQVTEETAEPVDGLEDNETLSEQSTKSFSSFFAQKIAKTPLVQSEKQIAPAANSSRLFHSSNPNHKRSSTSVKKPFKNKEAEKYYQSAVEQCMRIKYKLDKYHQQANWHSKPSRITFDLSKDSVRAESTRKFETLKDTPAKELEEQQNQIRLPQLDKIAYMKSMKPSSQFREPKIRITYPTHTIRYKVGTNGYKLQHKVKQQVVSDNKVKTVYRDPIPESLQTMKVKHEPTSERDRATLQQLKTKLQHKKLPLVAAGLLQQKTYNENTEEGMQQSKYEKAVIKQHPTVRQANVLAKMAFKSKYNRLLQKSGLLYQEPSKCTEDNSKNQEDVTKGQEKLQVQGATPKLEEKDEKIHKMSSKPSKTTPEPPAKTAASEVQVSDHPISIAKQVKVDSPVKHPKRILSEKPESFDVDSMCIKNKNSSNTTTLGDYIVESEEKLKNFVEKHKQEDKELQATQKTEPVKEEVKTTKSTAAKEAASTDTIGKYLQKLKELRDQTAMEGVNVKKSETNSLRQAESTKIKEPVMPARKAASAIIDKGAEKKRHPSSDQLVLKKKELATNRHKDEEGTVIKTQSKSKARSQSAISLVQGKSTSRPTPVKSLRSDNLVKKVKLKPLTPTKRKPLEKVVQPKPAAQTVQKIDPNPLKKIMDQYKVPSQPETDITMAELKRINRRKRREREKKLKEEVKMQQKKFEEEWSLMMKQKEEQERKDKYRLDVAEIEPSVKNTLTKDENNNQAMQGKEKVVQGVKEDGSKPKTEGNLVKAAVKEQNQVPKENADKIASKLEEKPGKNCKEEKALNTVVEVKKSDVSKYLLSQTAASKATNLEKSGEKSGKTAIVATNQKGLTQNTEKGKESKQSLKKDTSVGPMKQLKEITDFSKEQILAEIEKASKKFVEKEKQQMIHKYALENSFKEMVDRVLDQKVADLYLKKEQEKLMHHKRNTEAPKKYALLQDETTKKDEKEMRKKEELQNRYSLEKYSSDAHFPKINTKKSAICAMEKNLVEEKASAKIVHSKELLGKNIPEQMLKQNLEKPPEQKDVSEKSARSVSREKPQVKKINVRKTKSEILQEKVDNVIVNKKVKEDKEKVTDHNLQLKEKTTNPTDSETPKKLKRFKVLGYKISRPSKENNSVDKKSSKDDDTKNMSPKPVDKLNLEKEPSTINAADEKTQEENLAKLKEASTTIVKIVKKLDIIKNIQMAQGNIEKSGNPENQPTIRKEKPPNPKDKSKKERPKSKRDIVLPPRGHTGPKTATEHAHLNDPNTNIVKETVKEAQYTPEVADEQSSNIVKDINVVEKEKNLKLEKQDLLLVTGRQLEKNMAKHKTIIEEDIKEVSLKKQNSDDVLCIDLTGSNERIKKNKQQKKDQPKLIIKLRYLGSTKAKTLKSQNSQSPKTKEKKLNSSKDDSKSTCSKTQHLEVNTDKIEKQSKGRDVPNIVIFKETPDNDEIVTLDRRSSSLCFSRRRRARIEDNTLKLTEIPSKESKLSANIALSTNNAMSVSKEDIVPSYFGRRKRRRIEDAQRSRSESITAVASATLKQSEHSVKNTPNVIKTLDKPAETKQETVESVPVDQKKTTKAIVKSKRVKNVWDTEHRDSNTDERRSTSSCLLTRTQSRHRKQEKSTMSIKKATKMEGATKTADDSKMTKEDPKPSSNIVKLLEVMKKADQELEDMLKAYQIYNIPQAEPNKDKTTKKSSKHDKVQVKKEGAKKVGDDTVYQKAIDSKTFVITEKEEGNKKEHLKPVGTDPPMESKTSLKPVKMEQPAKSLMIAEMRSKTKTEAAKSDKMQKKHIKAKPKVEETKKTKSTGKEDEEKLASKPNKYPSNSDGKTSTKLDGEQQREKDLCRELTQNEVSDKKGPQKNEQSKNKLTLKLLDGDGKEASGNKIVVISSDDTPGHFETGENKPKEAQIKEEKAVEIPGKRKTNIGDAIVHVSMPTDITQDIFTSQSKSSKVQLLLEKNLSDLKTCNSAKLHTVKNETGSDTGSKKPSKSSVRKSSKRPTGKVKSKKKQPKQATFPLFRSSLIDLFINPKPYSHQYEEKMLRTIFVSPKVSKKGKRPAAPIKHNVEVKRKNIETDLPPKQKKSTCNKKQEETEALDSKIITKKVTRKKLHNINDEATNDLKIAAKAMQRSKSEEEVIKVIRKKLMESLDHLKAQTSVDLNSTNPSTDRSKNIFRFVEDKTKKITEKEPVVNMDDFKQIYYGNTTSSTAGRTFKMLDKRLTKEAGKMLAQEKSVQDSKKEEAEKFREIPFNETGQTKDNAKRKSSQQIIQANYNCRIEASPKNTEEVNVYKKVTHMVTVPKDEARSSLDEETNTNNVEVSFKEKTSDEHNKKRRRKSKERQGEKMVEDLEIDSDRKLKDFNRGKQEKAVIMKALHIESLENISSVVKKKNNLDTKMSLIETENSESRRMKAENLHRLAKSGERKGMNETKNPKEKCPFVNIEPSKVFGAPKKLSSNTKNHKNETQSHFDLASYCPLEKPKAKLKSVTEPSLTKSEFKTIKQKEDKNKYKYTSQKIRQSLMKTNVTKDNKKTKTKRKRSRNTEEHKPKKQSQLEKKQKTDNETKRGTENRRYALIESKKHASQTIEIPGHSNTLKIEVIKEIPSKIIIPTNEIIEEMKKMTETPNNTLEHNEMKNQNVHSFLEQMLATDELQEVFSQYLPKKDNKTQECSGNSSEITVLLPPKNQNFSKFQPNEESEDKHNQSYLKLSTPNTPKTCDENSQTNQQKTEEVDNALTDLKPTCEADSIETKVLVSKTIAKDNDDTTKTIAQPSSYYRKFSFNQMSFDEIFAVEKNTTKAKIEEIFNKQTNEEEKIYKFNKKLARHFQQYRDRLPRTRQIMAPSKAFLDPRALEVNEMQKILHKFLATELKKPYHERPSGFSLLKKYNKFEGIVYYSKDKESQPKENQIEEPPKKNFTIYVEKTPPNKYMKKEDQPPAKPLPNSCEKLCLPLKNITEVALKPSVDELTTLNKHQVDKVQVAKPAVPSVLDKYRDLKITHLNIKRPLRKPDESFLPIVFATKSNIAEKKSDPDNIKRQVLEFRYELLRKLHKEFTAVYEKDVNKNVGKFDKVQKHYKSVIENLKKEAKEEFVVNPQSKSMDELLGPCLKPSFERVSRYYNLVIQKIKEGKNETSENATKKDVSNKVSEKILNEGQSLVEKLSEKTTELGKSRNKFTEAEKMLANSTEKDKGGEKDPEGSGGEN